MKDKIIEQAYQLPTPEPLFGKTKQVCNYPVDAFGEFKDVLEAIEDITQAPIEFAGQSFLAIASLCVQDLANVETLSGSSCPLSLYLLTLGKSGERKSSCDQILMKPVNDIQYELAKQHEINMKNYNINKDSWKHQYNNIIKSNKSSNSLNDISKIGSEPQEPIEQLMTISDPTVEGIFDLLEVGRPSIALMTDEGGKVFGGYGMNKDNRMKSISIYSNLWDASPINQVRRSTKSKTLYGKRFAMHILVQPEIAKNLFADGLSQAQGFLPRMLISYPKSKIGTRFLKEVNKSSYETLDKISNKIKTHLNRLSNIDKNELEFDDLVLSYDSKTLLSSFYNEVEKSQLKNGKYYNIIAYASKACEQVCRIAGVLTLFKDSKAQIVQADNVKNAIDLVRYYLDEAIRITHTIAVPEHLLKAEKLRLWLLEEYKGEFINSRIIVQYVKGSYKTASEANKGIEILLNHGWLIKSDEPQIIDSHRSKDAYFINRYNETSNKQDI